MTAKKRWFRKQPEEEEFQFELNPDTIYDADSPDTVPITEAYLSDNDILMPKFQEAVLQEDDPALEQTQGAQLDPGAFAKELIKFLMIDTDHPRPDGWMEPLSPKEKNLIQTHEHEGNPDMTLQRAFTDRIASHEIDLKPVEIADLFGVFVAKASVYIDGALAGSDIYARTHYEVRHVPASQAEARRNALSSAIHRLVGYNSITPTNFPARKLVQTHITDIAGIEEQRAVESLNSQTLFQLANGLWGGPENWRLDIDANAEYQEINNEAVLLWTVDATLETLDGRRVKDAAVVALSMGKSSKIHEARGPLLSGKIRSALNEARELAIQRAFAAISPATGMTLLGLDFHATHDTIPKDVSDARSTLMKIEEIISHLSDFKGKSPQQYLNEWLTEHDFNPVKLNLLKIELEKYTKASVSKAKMPNTQSRGALRPGHMLVEDRVDAPAAQVARARENRR